jgi:methylglutaconyl-CoA hydratase
MVLSNLPDTQTTMTYTHILLDLQPPVATVTLNRPEQHNAFDDTLISELTDCFSRLNGDESLRIIVIAGAGSSFCAGADLEWMGRMVGYSHEENLRDAGKLQRMFATIAESPKVTIAKVHGPAIGGGAGLVAVCDVAVASHGATFAFSEVKLGIAPAVIAPYVIQKVGVGNARAFFVTGERFGSDVAARIGLVQEVEAFSVDGAVNKKIESVLSAGPSAIAATKQLLREIAGRTPEEAADATVRAIAELRVSPEGQEGIRAFLEKRKPNFAE